VEPVSRESGEVPPREVGVEAAHGFGDCLFNVPLIRELKILHNTKIGVAVRPHCKDAFTNVRWISEIIEIPHMWHGLPALERLGYKRRYQITQNAKFYEFRDAHHPDHSLIHTPLWTGRQLHCPKDFDNRPLFFPTTEELMVGSRMKAENRPTIAIESVYGSAQSWADKRAFDMILAKYAHTHRILWLSNEGAPKIPAVDDMLRFTRRECIMCLQACEIFFSVGSGFFCASLALDPDKQPKKIVCLWTDDLYRYEEPLAEYKWHPDITWVHNHQELNQCLNQLQRS
jgi:hypothetical protein